MDEKMHASRDLVWVTSRHPDTGVVERRLRSYLSRDRTGIRREVLRLFINTRSLSIAELVAKLEDTVYRYIPDDIFDGRHYCLPDWHPLRNTNFWRRTQLRTQRKIRWHRRWDCRGQLNPLRSTGMTRSTSRWIQPS